MSGASYNGPALDGTVQFITERPELDEDDQDDGETVYCTPAEQPGEERTENVPVPEVEPDAEGQTSLDDWGWSQ